MGHSLVDVIIPTYRPGPEVRELLRRLLLQTCPVGHILIVNTDETKWDPTVTEGIPNAQVFHIAKSAFDHGLARNIKAAYARQLPKKGCRVIERYQRSFNYPSESRVKRIGDLDELGIKTFFCSNVCACYDRKYHLESGGFAVPSIFNEDMIFAGNAIKAGYAVAYVAEARVLHSHNYTVMEQFHRNFDNGVSQAMHPEIFEEIRSEGEGMKMVKKTVRYLLKKGKGYLIPYLVIQSACKLFGFSLGKKVNKLPERLIMYCTMSPDFWRNHRELLK